MSSKIIFFSLLFCFIFSCKNDRDNINKAKVKSLNKTFDFGVRSNRDSIIHTFRLQSVSEEPYLIDSVSQDCGCTTVNYTKDTIFSGEYANITVSYIPNESDKGKIVKSIVILDNSESKFQVFYLQGEIVDDL